MSAAATPNFSAIDQAIAAFEGFGKAGTLATVNNNPGNIIGGQFATNHGATSVDANGFAVFPDAGTGVGAEDALVTYYANKGATIQDLISSWAPPTAPGNSSTATNNYINYVSGIVGVSPGTPVSQTSGLGQSAILGTPSTLASPLGTGATPVTPQNPLDPMTSLTNMLVGTATGNTGLMASGAAGASNVASTLTNAIGAAVTAGINGSNPFSAFTSALSGFSYPRVGAFLLGLIVVAGGIYLFKPVQQVVSSGIKKGTAALAA